MKILIFILCILAAIILGTKTKINIGVFALLFAMVLNFVFFQQAGSATLKSYFPTGSVPIMICSMMFFGCLSCSGVVNVLTRRVGRKMKSSKALAAVLMVWLLTFAVGFAVGGSTVIMYAVVPFGVNLMIELGLNPTLGVVAVWGGYLSCGFFPWSGAGVVNGGLADNSFEAGMGQTSTMISALLLIVYVVILLVVLTLITRKKDYSQFRDSLIQTEDDESLYTFTDTQRRALIVIICVMTVIIVPNVLGFIARKSALFKLLKKLDIAICFMAGSLALCALKCADMTEVISKKMPWKNIVLLFGMCTLFGLAQPLGLVDAFAALASKLPPMLIAPILAGSQAFLSSFVSGLVLGPLFVPLCGPLAAASGLPIAYLCALQYSGAAVSSVSPASGAGAICLSTIGDAKISSHVAAGMAKVAVANVFGYALFAFIAQFLF